MKRYRLYFGNHSMRSFHSIDDAIDWADRCLSCPANLYDYDEYLCTI